jgi:hypothetical protein
MRSSLEGLAIRFDDFQERREGDHSNKGTDTDNDLIPHEV